MGVPQPDYGAQHVAALVLIVEPGRQRRVDPDLVARTLELTRPESQVAVRLAEGKTVRDMAQATGHTERAIFWEPLQEFVGKTPDVRLRYHGLSGQDQVGRAAQQSGAP